MKIHIDSSVIKNFPHVKIGVLVGKNLDNAKPSEKIALLLRSIEVKVRSNYTLEEITTLPKIADWREAYRAFGCKPSEYRSSIEALLRRVLQGKELPSINPLVDLYNIMSLRSLVPAGGGDLDRVNGDITLTPAHGTEQFVMLGHSEPVTVKQDEVIYRDAQEVLCRAWNYRESDKTKITPYTKNVYFFFEGLAHTSHEEIEHILADAKKLVEEFCNGTCITYILDKENATLLL